MADPYATPINYRAHYYRDMAEKAWRTSEVAETQCMKDEFRRAALSWHRLAVYSEMDSFASR